MRFMTASGSLAPTFFEVVTYINKVIGQLKLLLPPTWREIPLNIMYVRVPCIFEVLYMYLSAY